MRIAHSSASSIVRYLPSESDFTLCLLFATQPTAAPKLVALAALATMVILLGLNRCIAGSTCSWQQLLDSCISKQVRRAPLSTGPCLGFRPIPCRLPLVEAQAKPLPAQVTRCLLLKHTSPAFRPGERSCLFVYRHAHPFSRAT